MTLYIYSISYPINLYANSFISGLTICTICGIGLPKVFG